MALATMSLLDRLITSEGGRRNDMPVQHGRIDYLCNDLALLFNSTGLSTTSALRPASQVARSVLNFGLSSVVGAVLSSVELKSLETHIRTVICHFEPRIVGHSLDIQLQSGAGQYNLFKFLLKGDVRLANGLCPFRLLSTWNTGNGHVKVQPYGAQHG